MLSYLNALIGFAAVFSLFALLVTTLAQLVRSGFHLKHQFLAERLRRLFGELKCPDRFVAAMLAHPSLEGHRGKEYYGVLTNPAFQNDAKLVKDAIATVLGSGTRPRFRAHWWSRTSDLDKQTVKDVGQAVYEQIGPLVDYSLKDVTTGEAFRWAQALSAKVQSTDSGTQPFRGKLWTLATTAFPEAEGKAPALKTYVAAFHDEAQASASDGFTRWMRSVTTIIALLVSIAFGLDVIQIWSRLMRADPAKVEAFARSVQSLGSGGSDVSPEHKAGEASAGSSPSSVEHSSGIKTEIANQLKTLNGAPITLCVLWTWKLNTGDTEPCTPSDTTFPGVIAGLLLSWVALSLGAPFWFEMLKSAINMKSAFTPTK